MHGEARKCLLIKGGQPGLGRVGRLSRLTPSQVLLRTCVAQLEGYPGDLGSCQLVTDLRILGYDVLLSAIIYCQNIAEVHYYSDRSNQMDRSMNRKTFVLINIFIYHQSCR